MVVVRAADFRKNPGRYQSIAMREPVVLMSDRGEEMVLLSIEEYRRLKRRDRQVLRVEELSEEDLRALTELEIPEECAAFNHEVES